jgi:alpha-beta hydrolase superfamily lysophospholipase
MGLVSTQSILEEGYPDAVVGRRSLLLAAVVAALAWSGSALAAVPQQLTFTASDGAKLACSVVVPDAPAPAGGYPGLILFHGLGGRHEDMEPLGTQVFAPAGYETLECDARGHGASEGLFGLDGARDVQDTKELFAYLQSRTGNASIGALGISLGGGAVWNALTSGVPFKAAVPMMTWTNLVTALAPQGLSKSGLVQYLAGLVPTSRWDPQLLAASQGLTTSADLTAATALGSSRSPTSRLPSLTTPTFLIQGRHDFLFDIDQALAAYRSLKGPKRLYLGDLGHSPGISPFTAPDAATFWAEALRWFDRYVKGTPNGVQSQPPIILGHDPWDGKPTTYKTLPETKVVSVTLPGTSTLSGGTAKAVRSARLTGGPHETFGDSTVVVRYSNAKNWDRLVAVLAVQGSSTPITAGGVKLKAASGKVTIRLMNQAVRFASGKRLVLYLGPTSLIQDPANALYLATVQPDAAITIGRVTLNVSVLRRAVSR